MKNPFADSSHRIRRALVAGLALPSLAAFAETFTIDEVQSTLTLSGDAVGVPFQAQGVGSLETQYSGTIIVTFSGDNITFSGGSAAVADNSGSWEPKAGGAAGSEPANYGAIASNPLATAKAAARKVQFDILSGSIPVVNGSFAASSTDLSVPAAASAVIDYLVAGLFNQAGKLPFSGTADNSAVASGTLFTAGDTQTLSLPIDASYSFKLLSDGDTTVTLKGKLVATRSVGGGGNNFEGWAAQFFPGVNDPAVIGPDADPDGDGVPNFPEWAFGLDPTQPNPGFAPLEVRLDPAHPDVLTLEFVRPKGLEGVAYTLRVLQSPDDWKPLGVTPEITDLGDGRERLTFRDTQPIGGAAKTRFIQLQVTKL